MKKFFFPVLVAVIIAVALLIYSCGGNSGGPGTGTVGFYVTDDMSLYSQVTGTINKVRLVNTGSGATCDVLTVPMSANIANLASVLQLVDVTQCPAGSYNRFRLLFDRNVELMSGATGTNSPCTFTSYLSGGEGMQPNMLNCDPITNICTLDVNGGVNVLADRDNKLALDFDLKNFNVMNYAMPDCSVTMKVSPLTPDQMNQHGSEAITGIISGLDTVAITFNLKRGNRTFIVNYSGITPASQPDVDTLLRRAEDDGLKAMVTSSTIDLAGNSITAALITVKIEGIVSGLTNTMLTVNYGAGGAKSISADYSNAVVDGTIADGSWVELKLIGHDPVSNSFIASKVEVQTAGMMTEN